MSKQPSAHASNLENTAFALSIAGSDSCGGAGLQADLKTFTRLGCYGATVVTAVTAQNTAGVSAVDVMTDKLVSEQLQRVLDELPIAAAKTGMLANHSIIQTVARQLRGPVSTDSLRLVVDPVMVATSGARLLDEDAVAALREELIPLASLVTPNLPEAEALSGIRIHNDKTLQQAGERILEMGADAVLMKGGHGQKDQVIDRLLTATQTRNFSHPRRPGQFHGTGCVLSAAITSTMAAGDELEPAIEQAMEYLQLRLRDAIQGKPLALALLP